MDEDPDDDEQEEDDSEITLFKVSDEDGSLDMDFVKDGEITRADLCSNVSTLIIQYSNTLQWFTVLEHVPYLFGYKTEIFPFKTILII